MYYEKLRSKYDIEQHLRLLQALGENTKFNLMVGIFNTIKTTKINTGKTGRIQEK